MLIFALTKTRTKLHQIISKNLSKSFKFYHKFTTFTQQINKKTPITQTQLSIINPKPLTKPQLKTLINSHFKNGKFFDILRNVVASPSVLLTCAQNLTRSAQLGLDSVSTRFDLLQLAHQLTHNEFDPGSCCISLDPTKNRVFRNGYPLVLPNLKLKVVIEALRLVLDVVFDGGFATFCYGGRDGLGRHTAVRYLKNVVESPAWWFSIVFSSDNSSNVFDCRHVGRLCSIIRSRIDDDLFVGLIEKLFGCNVVRIELGSGELGKGLPQECGLCGILINIYLNGFDKKVQKIRLRMNEGNPKVVDGVSDVVMYKPVKVYAVRYLDEILMITSSSKVFARDLLNWCVEYLEEELELSVDKSRSCIHSATSEKIGFLGMELQAVPPSVLRPPLSEKAKRARQKFRRQKEVEALELKNMRERNRKKLGMKLFSHVFKKLKKSGGFQFECKIENEVSEIFRAWADEVVREFMGTLEERMVWHRLLTSGDFLSLKRIRDQLPQELVDAYDKFQEEVDRHLSPVELRKAMEEEERIAEEEEERKYNERTLADMTKLCMKVMAPIVLIRKAVRLAGFTNNMGRPRPISFLTSLDDADIVKWYAGVGIRWLEYFACCRNFEMVKTIVTYHLRFSCLLTLAEKHDATKNQTIRHYTKDLKVLDVDGNEQTYFPTEREVKKMGDAHLSDPKPVDTALTMSLMTLVCDEPSYRCSAHFCDRKDTVTYRIWLLKNRLGVDPMDQDKWVSGMAVIHDGLDRKCFPLCAEHISEFYMGRLTLQDIDCTSFVDVDR
ncbi:hypothetical protein vseg_012422 [Gypsophila vaccaria]